MIKHFDITKTYKKGDKVIYEDETWEYDPPRKYDEPIIGKVPRQGNYFYPSKDEIIRHILKELTDDQRIELFSEYCSGCGCDDPFCQCYNDE